MPLLTTPALPPGSLSGRPQPELRGDGLLLRPWTAADRPAVVAGFADPAIQRWHCRSATDAEAREWIAGWAPQWQAETGAGWAVLEGPGSSWHKTLFREPGQSDLRQPTGGLVVGQISLRRINLYEGLAAVSYWVLPDARGRRVAPRALAALTDWSFGTLGLHRLELHHSTANPASCRVAERAGFAAEGTKRSEARHADGWHDMHAHARLATD